MPIPAVLQSRVANLERMLGTCAPSLPEGNMGVPLLEGANSQSSGGAALPSHDLSMQEIDRQNSVVIHSPRDSDHEDRS